MEFKYPYAMPTNYQSPGVPTKECAKPNKPLTKSSSGLPVDSLSFTVDPETCKKVVPKLFQPLTIKDTTLKNRIVVSPMCQYSCIDGAMNDWHLVHLGSFAKGGASMIIFEASAVVANGRISPFDSGIWCDEQIAPLKRINDFVHTFKCLTTMQIAHAGRKASTIPPFLENGRMPSTVENSGWTNLDGASPLAWDGEHLVPHELTVEEIQSVVQAFVDAAIRCEKAGFDAVEIHGAHGYLIDSFLSPTSNKRTDQYGGSFLGRIKLLLDIVKAVRAVWKKLLLVRISCEEWVADGWHLDDSIALARHLHELDVDILDCSSGGNSHNQKIAFGPLYQVPFAEGIKKAIPGLITSAVGLINTPEEAMSVIDEQRADIVMMARPFLRDPFWPLHAAHSIGLEVDYALQYNMAKYR
ncbi:NADH:flavin oxidoreductase/NADH oxidase domain-containing protein [Heterostelium album PN500]|uniref:NADH:flavin oxidoreductase/NADH oxidase domain-containing protein n=1 Tax=Heterostelium pallidum (strain ATCC 26659 / Pp 5 / PN500) TaxID=670386 RepID=D3BGN9_HETP5|nr:NADH:flavin oxidoreductase/NADH oxidase domain-containing protein [Heterostelium album PN500]EFA79273.1 NADH:flavin oxidoreductase/NADH oxidase domain-containing protein [Heterostelium album PN500]|eukprot:XP_020431394.1 NADH:flavin oxidoreductase/NADH oxidase domain-containing protein [Heterostelium album PN500]